MTAEPESDVCAGLRATIDILERRQEELASQLAMADRRLEEGRAFFADLYKRHFVDGDDHDKQLADMCEWARIEVKD